MAAAAAASTAAAIAAAAIAAAAAAGLGLSYLARGNYCSSGDIDSLKPAGMKYPSWKVLVL